MRWVLLSALVKGAQLYLKMLASSDQTHRSRWIGTARQGPLPLAVAVVEASQRGFAQVMSSRGADGRCTPLAVLAPLGNAC